MIKEKGLRLTGLLSPTLRGALPSFPINDLKWSNLNRANPAWEFFLTSYTIKRR